MPNLSEHDLRQMDPTWQQRQPEDTVRGLLARALDDLRQARDRLNQDPGNSSRPSGSMEPWRAAGAAQPEVSSPEAAAIENDAPPEAPGSQPVATAPPAASRSMSKCRARRGPAGTASILPAWRRRWACGFRSRATC